MFKKLPPLIAALLIISCVTCLTGCIEKEKVAMPDLKGMTSQQVTKKLDSIKFYNRELKTEQGGIVPPSEFFKVLYTTPEAGAKVDPDEQVTIVFENTLLKEAEKRAAEKKKKKEEEERKWREEEAKKPKPNVDEFIARQACEDYANQQTPNKLKIHWLIGMLNKKVDPDGTMYFKVEATETLITGKELKINIECAVNGNDKNPQVTYFMAY